LNINYLREKDFFGVVRNHSKKATNELHAYCKSQKWMLQRIFSGIGEYHRWQKPEMP
jgi:hypothetical protein